MAQVTPYPRSQLVLPLWNRVVFVDWNGVLSNDIFWSSIRNNPSHQCHKLLNIASSSLFAGHDERLDAWMRGQLRTDDIVHSLGVSLDRRFRPDFLTRRLREDCRKMACNQLLIKELRKVTSKTLVVLATDNMDCFLEQAHLIPDIRTLFDEILCSSSIGTLKHEDVNRFFGSWLDQNRLTFAQSILLDDSLDTCRQFQAAGGKAIHVTSIHDAIEKFQIWFNGPNRPY